MWQARLCGSWHKYAVVWLMVDIRHGLTHGRQTPLARKLLTLWHALSCNSVTIMSTVCQQGDNRHGAIVQILHFCKHSTTFEQYVDIRGYTWIYVDIRGYTWIYVDFRLALAWRLVSFWNCEFFWFAKVQFLEFQPGNGISPLPGFWPTYTCQREREGKYLQSWSHIAFYSAVF